MDSLRPRLSTPAPVQGPTAPVSLPMPALAPIAADLQPHPEAPAAVMLAACRKLRRAGDEAARLSAPPASEVRPARRH